MFKKKISQFKQIDRSFVSLLYNHAPFLYRCRLLIGYGYNSTILTIKNTVFHLRSDRQHEKYLSSLYRKRTKKTLDWSNLTTYREKMQWAKLYDRDPRKTQFSDKLGVRSWIRDQIGEEYLIPILGVWRNANEIDFSELPEEFVLKTTHYAGDTIIVRNKSSLPISKFHEIRHRMNLTLKRDLSTRGCQMHYHNIKPMIIAEALLEINPQNCPDYKFICFDGVPHFCWVDFNRFSKHSRCVFNMNWELQPWTISRPLHQPIPEKPQNFDEMVRIVKQLSDGFSHVRVDLYNINNKIYFGEMTFSSGNGFTPLEDDADILLGRLWQLNIPTKN